MTELKPSLDEVYQRWRTANPTQIVSGNAVPDGWRRCRRRGCITFIAADQERALCYGHGGKPNAPTPLLRPADYEAWVKNLQKGERIPHLRGRPYRA